MGEATRILSAIEAGDSAAAEQLLPLVYDELRKLAALRLAHEKPGQTLDATALVHEAFLKLVDGTPAQNWNSRGHFFAAAAEAMRRILVDNARRKRRPKAGGDLKRIEFDEMCLPTSRRDDELLLLHAASRNWKRSHPTRPSSSNFAISQVCRIKRPPRPSESLAQPQIGTGLTPEYSSFPPWKSFKKI